jgi:hypothetical protein
MDGSRFDALSRALVQVQSRRGVSRWLGGLLLGASVAVRDRTEPAAKPRHKRKKPKRKRDTTTPPSPPPLPQPACGAGGPCLVFLSSIRYTADLGGLAGADAKCQGLAEAAGLPGTYKAWLSDRTSAPASRFVPSPGPYRLVNGTTIAGEWGDLMDGALRAPIDVTETGGGPSSLPLVWTNTNTDGTTWGESVGEHCANWSTDAPTSNGRGGVATRSDSGWTARFGNPCASRYHLYCFQQR